MDSLSKSTGRVETADLVSITMNSSSGQGSEDKGSNAPYMYTYAKVLGRHSGSQDGSSNSVYLHEFYLTSLGAKMLGTIEEP